MIKRLTRVFIVLIILGTIFFLLIQLVPYGKDLTNPPVVSEPNWDNPRTRELAKRACFDCHSNETVWPWYSYIAPISWLVYRDAVEARQKFNFSDWQTAPLREPDEVAEVINEGEMPPIQYLLMHPEARLTPAEKQQLIQGLNATMSR
jgi:hypothetical protein